MKTEDNKFLISKAVEVTNTAIQSAQNTTHDPFLEQTTAFLEAIYNKLKGFYENE